MLKPYYIKLLVSADLEDEMADLHRMKEVPHGGYPGFKSLII